MNIPAQPLSDRWLQFPRFETIDPSGRVLKIAYPRRWLSPDMTAAITAPARALKVRHTDMKRLNNWVGEMHVADEFALEPMHFRSPLHLDQRIKYGARFIIHEFLQDPQAIPGRRWEIVLESHEGGLGKPTEVMALMGRYGYDFTRDEPGSQLLAMRTKNGEWYEPSLGMYPEGPVARMREHYLENIGRMALNGRTAEEILKLG